MTLLFSSTSKTPLSKFKIKVDNRSSDCFNCSSAILRSLIPIALWSCNATILAILVNISKCVFVKKFSLSFSESIIPITLLPSMIGTVISDLLSTKSTTYLLSTLVFLIISPFPVLATYPTTPCPEFKNILLINCLFSFKFSP